jgi:hypothetical protein
MRENRLRKIRFLSYLFSVGKTWTWIDKVKWAWDLAFLFGFCSSHFENRSFTPEIYPINFNGS